MNDLKNYKVNEDRSVTVSTQNIQHEHTIRDILRIEKTKGGFLASRRMKKSAIKYAQSERIPEVVVERLMLEYYPNDFYESRNLILRLVLRILAYIFFIGGIFCISPWMIYVWDYPDPYQRLAIYGIIGTMVSVICFIGSIKRTVMK